MYFSNSHASRLLPMPAGPMTRHEARPLARAPVAWNRSLSRRSSSSRPTNGASSGLRPARAAALGDDAHRPPRRHGRGLALEHLLAGRLERDRRARGALRRLADEDGAGRRDRLQPAGGVDEVAGDHALVRRADGDGRLAGQDAGARLDAGAERLDRVDELERRPDGPLGVVLVGDRRAPDGHDGVADELLDRAAVALDDLARRVEVADSSSRVFLRVASLGEGREADEVGEQDRHQPPLSYRSPLRS